MEPKTVHSHTPMLVYCTCPDHATAVSLANTLVDEALAACINIVPGLTSIYHWQGKRETGSEELLMIKTIQEQYPTLQARIVALHPYELPEVIAVSIQAGLPAYLDWIDTSCHRNTMKPNH
ncbi:divalent-cation tolerance protein CutA [Sulfuriflexus mobilis]|uniref:divalent-cation tolerance protein CutA n=1 Tax=Sulfuriflexus mobilis TaxID=1811807 RepID=UPI0018D52106|nr:divalent-cation tolerance protein CutA [Sulfuriflexus mobilis]